MRDIHRVDEDVSHVGLPSLLDVVPGLGEIGTRRIRFRHAGQRPHLGERIARDLHRRLRHRPPHRRGPQHVERAVGEVETVERERSGVVDGAFRHIMQRGYDHPHFVTAQLLPAVPQTAFADASGDLLPDLQRILRFHVLLFHQLRHVVAPPPLREQQRVKRRDPCGVLPLEVPVGRLDRTPQFGSEQQRRVDAARRRRGHRRAIRHRNREIARGRTSVGIGRRDGERDLRALFQRTPHLHVGRRKFFAPIEDQTLGERIARLVQQQDLENTARQVAAAEDQRGVVVVPRFMVADVSAAVHQQFQPLGQRPSGDGQHREILLRLQDFQDAGRVPRCGQVETFGLSARHRAFGVVAFARMGREAQTAHAAVQRAKRVDHLVAVVLHHARDLDRSAVVSQCLEGHAAVVAVDQVAPFGEERDVEVRDFAHRGVALRPAALPIGPDRERLLEEVLRPRIAHVERVGRKRVVPEAFQ